MTHIRSIAVAALLLTGCFGSHGSKDDPMLDPILDGGLVDDPTEPDDPAEPDDPTEPDDPGDPVVSPEEMCAPNLGKVTVRYEDVHPAPGTGSCRRGDGLIEAQFLGAEPSHAEEGVILNLDGCPLAEAPCPCAITVGGIGADLAPQIGLLAEGTTVSGAISDAGVSLYTQAACGRCVGCACPPARVLLHAADGPIGDSVMMPPGLEMSSLATTCEVHMRDGCTFSHVELEAETTWYDGMGPREAAVSAAPQATARGALDDAVIALRVLRSDMMSCPEARFAYTPAYVVWHEPVFVAHR